MNPMFSTMGDPEIPLEWLYARQREVAKTQNRYLLLLLIGSAYTVGAHFTPGQSVAVPFLGLGVARELVEGFAVTALAVLILAFYGTGSLLTSALKEIHGLFGKRGQQAVDCLVQETANVLDYLGYTVGPGKTPPRLLSRALSLFLYHLPLVLVLAWTVILWWIGLTNRPFHPPWLVVVHIVNGCLLFGATTKTIQSLKRKLQKA